MPKASENSPLSLGDELCEHVVGCEDRFIARQHSECRTPFEAAQDSHASHSNPLPEGEGAIVAPRRLIKTSFRCRKN